MIPVLLFIGSALLMALSIILTAHMTENKTDHPTLAAAFILLVALASISLAAYSGERTEAGRTARVEVIENILSGSAQGGRK